MATLVFSAVGTALGGPIGGAIGSLVGRQLDTALFGTARQGARLKELDATTSTYGQPIPRHYGVMRVAGSIIWATELREHSETQGTGKGSPSITTYSYSANFAVALSSRPIRRIGRIWADGKLLRGEDGTLKAGGTLRIHTGQADQAVDPLLAAFEGTANCPAYRGLAYVVFEDLDLSDYYNHIPALTFEVFADDTFDLQDILADAIDDVDAAVDLGGIAGFSCDGPVISVLETLDSVIPLDADAAGDRLVIAHAGVQEASLPLPEPARPLDGDGFGSASGFARRRAPPAQSPIALLRYYDCDRDYLPGIQRAPGQPAPGEPRGLELPATLDAPSAADLIRKTRQQADWSRETIAWRTTQLDTAVAPGTLVSLPEIAGNWRVREWEWCDSGVELALERMAPASNPTMTGLPTTPGRFNEPLDATVSETILVAYELPLDAASGQTDSTVAQAAVSCASDAWPGAALYADHGDGELHSLGSSGRTRCIVGTTSAALPAASLHVFDRSSELTVTLIDPAMQLVSASSSALAQGANLALVGEELIQFARATALGNGSWRIEGLLRGRGGSEAGMAGHASEEPFVLLDGKAKTLDPAVLGTNAARRVVAVGLYDETPVQAPVRLDGITRRPLSPVHPRRSGNDDGSLLLSWTRRARGAWDWPDGIDVPLVEEVESYLVTFGNSGQPLASWSTAGPELLVPAAILVNLSALDANALFQVRQQGTHALSAPLILGPLP